MTMVQIIVDEVKTRYRNGLISKITAGTVTEIAEELFPEFDWENSDLIFQAMMKF